MYEQENRSDNRVVCPNFMHTACNRMDLVRAAAVLTKNEIKRIRMRCGMQPELCQKGLDREVL